MMKKTVTLGFFMAIAMICSYIEVLIPLPIPIPGIKLGLANFVVVLLLYSYGGKEAALVNFTRIMLSGFIFSNMSMILYSLAGGIVSLLFMLCCKRMNCFSTKGVSIVGAVSHNLGQLLLAFIIVRTNGLIFYTPFLIIAGVLTGYVIGMLAQILNPIIASMKKI